MAAASIGIAGVHEPFRGADGRVVHHFQPGGNDAGGDDRGDRGPGRFHVVEGRQQDLRASRGFGSSLTVTSVMTPSSPSEPVISASRS